MARNIDIIFFESEIDLLVARLSVLHPFVHQFIIIENQPVYHTEPERSSERVQLIHHALLDIDDEKIKNQILYFSYEQWQQVDFQLCKILELCPDLQWDDYLFISRTHDIWNPERLSLIQSILAGTPHQNNYTWLTLYHTVYYYHFHWIYPYRENEYDLFVLPEQKHSSKIYPCVTKLACLVKTSPEHMYQQQNLDASVMEAGWSCQFFTTADRIKRLPVVEKIGHNENYIWECMQQGKTFVNPPRTLEYQSESPVWFLGTKFAFEPISLQEYQEVCLLEPRIYFRRVVPWNVRFCKPLTKPRNIPIKQAIVLIMTCEEPPYDMIEREAVAKTWAQPACIPPEVTVIYFYGFQAGQDPNQFPKEPYLVTTTEEKEKEETKQNQKKILRLFIPMPEAFHCMYTKTMMAMEWVLKHYPDCQYILRSNISSYFCLPLWFQWLHSLPVSSEYMVAGDVVQDRHTKYVDREILASGTGYTLSRKLAEYLVSTYKTPLVYKHKYDDCELSERIRAVPCKWIHQPYFPFSTIDEDGPLERDINKIPVKMQYRCKRLDNRQVDVENMHLVHQKLLQSGIYKNMTSE